MTKQTVGTATIKTFYTTEASLECNIQWLHHHYEREDYAAHHPSLVALRSWTSIIINCSDKKVLYIYQLLCGPLDQQYLESKLPLLDIIKMEAITKNLIRLQ